ncbi:MAG: hypothetical protein KGZ69_12025 [Methylomonas sp.]|nr:hypothetical protein [Methylomonas sp.]
MNWEAIQGVVRHVLTFGGGFLVTSGTIGASELETGVGAIVSLIGIIWSVVAKRKKPTA